MLLLVLVDMVGGVGEAGQVEQEGDRHLPQEVLHLHHHQGEDALLTALFLILIFKLHIAPPHSRPERSLGC